MPQAALASEAPPHDFLSGAALFLDFDGTLSPLQDDANAVWLPEGGAEMLDALEKALGGALALISGRDGRDLSRRVPTSLWRAGNHGNMVLAPGVSEPGTLPEAPADLLRAAEAIAHANRGVFVEEKAAVLAIHTRANPEAEPAVLDALRGLAAKTEGYKLQHGKRVIELKPVGMDKGVAIERLMEDAPFAGRRPVFFGDDATDEDGFAVVQRLGGEAVKVGDGDTIARYRLDDPDDVWAFLKEALNGLS
ncbi:trehalose-phosphatase [Parvularcula dongshanensis]|uniref:Trehalose 6-phosphate phosphatase n=1 Tax=Parvularcula dongshanensis TaxID=1173995 RepID=A0A840I5Q6_9PROT|nr:trehalose-phosphatase [Parvularcula dongshanensis]MBB4659603.1 trehalose 6-phosphate phosphatase [Parvularcula dongshanensis]